MTAFADLVRAGKVLYIGVSEWNAEQIAAGAALARELDVQLISNQPQYSMLWRVIEEEVVPTSEKEGLSQIVWSPLAQGILTGKYQPGEQPPADSRAGHAEAGQSMRGFLTDEILSASRSCARSPTTSACRWLSWPSPGCCRTRTWRPRSSVRRGPSRSTTTSRPPA